MNMDHPEYTRLAAVLQAAYNQAARGKGKERHASAGQAFEDQPMSAINRTLGSIDGFLFQAAKKAQEARRLPSGRAQDELLGAINYLAGAVIALDTWAAGTLPQSDPAQAPVVAPPPPAHDPNSVALPSLCCGNPSLCEQPCFHRHSHPVTTGNLVTGEELSQQVSQDGDGWIAHDGGPCPVPPGTRMQVQWANGRIYRGCACQSPMMFADCWAYITHYKLISTT